MSRGARGGLLAALVAGAVVVAACGDDNGSSSGSSAAGGSGGKQVKITYIDPYIGNGYQISFECGLIEAAKKNANVALEVQGAPKWGPDVQIPIIQAAAAKRPEALITSATDSTALAPIMRQVKGGGTKVVIYDSLMDDRSIPSTQVSSDNYGGGKILGEYIAKALDGKGTIQPIDIAPGVASTNARAKGVLEVLKGYPDIKILKTQYDGLDAQKNASIVNASLSANPNLTAIVPMYNDAANAALAALRARGKVGKVRMFTFDGDPKIITAVRNGDIEAVVSQQPGPQADKTLALTMDAIDGKSVQKDVQIPMLLIDKSNVDKADVKTGFYVQQRCK